ncbi:hypothetical protein GTU79_07060 [Sodalis ligni]|uniref:hypothetical protein n=1 Tax=Sodalis ligni TaxID=2697027 RepID=UPI001BDF165C|nr:hypothetical protein [Sodalis ligni]QWA12489.1 hypothetical protein GTU79_07060 [Sodalis ligni]
MPRYRGKKGNHKDNDYTILTNEGYVDIIKYIKSISDFLKEEDIVSCNNDYCMSLKPNADAINCALAETLSSEQSPSGYAKP